MTLLTICQDAAEVIGIPKPSAIVNSSDTNARQLLALANRTGKSLAKEHSWQVLTKEGSFTTVAAESQGALTTIASDYDRLLDNTLYNRNQTWKVIGPRSAQSWAAEKGLISSTIRDTFRLRGGNIIMTPTPTAGETIYFEYVSKNWCENASGTDQDAFAADADVALLDEDLITLGVIWRFKQVKGFAYGEEQREYERRLNQLKHHDKGARTLSMREGGASRSRVPEGSWDLS